jgi:peroxiredoxin Q/BCP
MGKNVSSTLKVGDAAPLFTLQAANAEGPIALEDLVKRGPVFVEFLRGTWCPNCKTRMKELEAFHERIAKVGTLVYVAAEKTGGIFKPVEYFAENPSHYAFLLDEDRSVTKAYGVYVAFKWDSANIAMPATFAIGTDGLIKKIYVGSSQFDRSDFIAFLAFFEQGQTEWAQTLNQEGVTE